MSAEELWGTVAARERGALPEQIEAAQLRAEVERWRREARAVVDTYYVASGKMVIDGRDGYDPIRALRVHLEES